MYFVIHCSTREPVMSVTAISEKLSVSAQPSVRGIRLFRDRGFGTLINNRPDDEEPSQQSSEAERQEAKQCGLAYAFIPVTSETITEADVRAFQRAVAASEGPVVAHCKTGTRSLNLYLIGEALDGRMSAEEVVEFGRPPQPGLRAAPRSVPRSRASSTNAPGASNTSSPIPRPANAPSSIPCSISTRRRARRHPRVRTRS